MDGRVFRLQRPLERDFERAALRRATGADAHFGCTAGPNAGTDFPSADLRRPSHGPKTIRKGADFTFRFTSATETVLIAVAERVIDYSLTNDHGPTHHPFR